MITDKEIQILKEMHFNGEISEDEFQRRMEQARAEETETREKFMKAIAGDNGTPKTMTEQEAINYFKKYIDFCEKDGMGIPSKEPYDLAISALGEVQQYRALGTVEDIKKIISFLSLDGETGLIDDANLLNQYRMLGTVEKLREARERQRAKKPEYKYLKSLPNCPTCGEVNLQRENEYGNVVENYSYCPDCGQKVDWSSIDNS